MTTKYDSVKCKSCARVLAAVSATGLVPTTSPEHAGCSTCQRFDSLYDAIRAADTEWAVLENKRDSISKSFARDNHKRSHMEFDNWLMTVEAPGPPRDAQKGHPENKDLDKGDVIKDNEQQMPGTKRRRTHSSTTQRAEDASDLTAHEQQGIPLSLRPSPKRSRSAASSTGRKRLKFSDSVEFHENYRSSEQYHRPSETYARGRNAPPEGSEYMDTSGSGLTFLNFTGMKKVGAKWVELSEEELAKQSEKAKTWAELRKLATAGKPNVPPVEEDAEGEVRRDEDAPQDPRAARLARRAKGASSAESAQARGATSRRGRGTSRKGKQPSLDSAMDDVQQTVCNPAPVSTTTKTANGKDHHPHRSLDRVEIIASGDDGLGRRSDAVPDKATTAAMCADQVQDTATPHNELHMDSQMTSEAKCQGNAAQPSISTAESQPRVVSGHGLLQAEPTKNTPCTGHDASEIGIQEASSVSRVPHPTSTIHEDSKMVNTDSSRLPNARPEAGEDLKRDEDVAHNSPRPSTHNTTTFAEKAIAVEAPLQEPSAEHLVKDLNTSTSADNESQLQGHSNVDIASATILQDPDRPTAARTSTEEMQI